MLLNFFPVESYGICVLVCFEKQRTTLFYMFFIKKVDTLSTIIFIYTSAKNRLPYKAT